MMFTCRAKRLDNDELVEGYYFTRNKWIDNSRCTTIYKIAKPSFTNDTFEVDPSTLQLSFNGTDWFDVATIKEALEVKNRNTLEPKKIMKLICPFCNGSKTKPLTKAFRSQECTDCDSNGFISKAKAKEYGIYDDCKQVEFEPKKDNQ